MHFDDEMPKHISGIVPRAKCEQVGHQEWMIDFRGGTYFLIEETSGWKIYRRGVNGPIYSGQFEYGKEDAIAWIETQLA